MKKRDLLFIGALLAVALAFFAYTKLFQKPGLVAEVLIVGKPTRYISLKEDKTHHIDGKLPVTLEVKGGAIRFVNSVCPDHICEGYQFISRVGEQAICMPAGVSVSIVEKS